MKYAICLYCVMMMSWGCQGNKCAINSCELIQAIEMGDNGEVSYSHEVLIKDLSVTCLDSISVMNVVEAYRGSVSFAPVRIISIFKSKAGFDEGETLSQPDEYWRNELLSISYDLTSGKAIKFKLFKTGKSIYEGERWPTKQ